MTDLIVKVGKYRMNRHCRAERRHKPSEAKHCPYCRVCPHGATEYMHCHECNKDKSWRERPITREELEDVLDYLASCGNGPGYLVRQSGRKRDGDTLPLIPLGVAELRKMLRTRG